MQEPRYLNCRITNPILPSVHTDINIIIWIDLKL